LRKSNRSETMVEVVEIKMV